MEKRLWEAVHTAKYATSMEVRKILKENPKINVNWRNMDDSESTALSVACRLLHENIIPLLLAHPDMDLNQKIAGETLFGWGCSQGKIACVRMLLRDGRVNLNMPDNLGFTPLWWAASNGHLEVIKWWIVSGREMDLGKPKDVYTDAVMAAKGKGKAEITALLEKFKANPAQARSEIRKELQITGETFFFFPALLFFLSPTPARFPRSFPPSSPGSSTLNTLMTGANGK